jgi:hypothetical protein
MNGTALPGGRSHLLTGEHARGQREEQRPEPDRTDLGAMNLLRWLAAVFVMLAVAGCAQVATSQREAPYAMHSSDPNGEDPRDRGGEGGGGDDGASM